MDIQDKAGVGEGGPLLGASGPPTHVTTAALLRWGSALAIGFLLSMEAMGYQALLPALYQSGQFRWICDDSERAACNASTQTEACCPAQQRRLDLMFTLAYVGLNVASFPLSILMHRIPPRHIAAGALLIKALSYCLLALSTDGAEAWLGSDTWQDMSLVAYTMVASLGLCACLPFLALPAYLFPAVYMGLASSSLMGAADASTLGYYVVRLLYIHKGVSLRVLFLGYGGMALLGAVGSYHLLKPLGSASEEAKKERAEGAQEGVWERVCSYKFLSVLQWYCAFFVCKYFYMTNILGESKWLTGSDAKALDLNTAFSIIMPATGVLIPLVGWLLTRGIRVSVFVNASLAAVLMVCSCVRVYALQYGMLVAVAASRFMVFSIMPTLCASPKMYGAEGGVFFSVMCGIGGVISLANFGFTALSHHSFLAMNLILGSLCIVATVHLLRFLTAEGIQ